MKHYKISEELLGFLLKYLQGRPHAEVDAGVQALRKLEEIKETFTPNPANKYEKKK